MSRQNEQMRCPFCGEEAHGMRVYNKELELERIEFRCSSLNCGAVTVFENSFCKALPDEAVYYFKARTGTPAIISALIGAAIALIAAMILFVSGVTYRAESVSRETIAPQTTAERQAAADGVRIVALHDVCAEVSSGKEKD